jgi:bis(5'-nucleosidyl)-tetraphosphatase
MHDTSYGVIPLIKVQGAYKFVLVLHSHGMFWGFPKGHAEPAETPFIAAQRELIEETQLTIAKHLIDQPLIERYSFIKEGVKIDKEVYFFVCSVTGEIKIDGKEILDYRLCNAQEAKQLLTYQEAQKLLEEVKSHLAL